MYMRDKPRRKKHNILRPGMRIGSDDILKGMFECKHGELVCAKCVGLGHCEHDCAECLDESIGQLGLFTGRRDEPTR